MTIERIAQLKKDLDTALADALNQAETLQFYARVLRQAVLTHGGELRVDPSLSDQARQDTRALEFNGGGVRLIGAVKDTEDVAETIPRYLDPQSPPRLLRAYLSGDEDYVSELEHESGPDGCAEGCPACADEAAARPGSKQTLRYGALCNLLLDADRRRSHPAETEQAIRLIVTAFAESEELPVEGEQ
jgi:hypothetical protein